MALPLEGATQAPIITMALKERIEEELKQALRSKDVLKTSCLRLIKAAVKNKEIDLRKELDDAQIIAVLSTLAKQRKESIEQFKLGNRNDLVEKETAELSVIESYRPKQLPREEVEKIVEAIVKKLGAAGPKDMGKVMKELMPQVQGKADGKLVNELVKKKLGGS